MKKIPFLILGISLINSVKAQDTGEVDYFFLSFKELMEVDVTGSTLTTEDLKSVPASVTTFSHDELSRMGLDTLDELMNIVPGFQSYRTAFSPLAYPFSSRGRRIGNSSSEVLILVDGQRLDSPRSSGSAVIAPKYPLINIERVEFIRGPGAAVYGSNAMMGVVNIITRSNVNELNVSYGSFNRKKIALLTSTQFLDGQLDIFAHFDKDDGDDYQVNNTFGTGKVKTDDPREMADLNIKFNWHDTYINFQHNQYETDNFYEADGIADDYNQRKADRTSVSLKQVFDWQDIKSYIWFSYNYSNLEIQPQLSGSNTSLGTAPLQIKPDFNDFSEIRVQWHNNWSVNYDADLQFGFEYRHINAPKSWAASNYDLQALAEGNFPVPYYGNMENATLIQDSSQRDIIGLYSQYQQPLTDQLNLTLGLRYDHFSSIDSQFSPRLGLVYEYDEHNNFKFLYGEAFRAPAENELNLLNNPRLAGNKNLKAETVQSWELIWVGQWHQTGITFGYFENHFKDSIVQNIVNGNVLQYQNEDQDPSKGIEFELTQELAQNWLIRATYTTIFETNDQSYREADDLFSLMVNYEQGKWNSNIIATWHGKREMLINQNNNDRLKLDDAWQLNGKIGYQFTQEVKGFIQIKNLQDKNHKTPASNALLTEGVINRGREVLAGFTWKF